MRYTETATDFFDELETAVKLRPDYAKVYNAFSQTFYRVLSQKTAETRIILGGTFAKTDYLLKEYGASHNLVRRVNDTRVRLRKRYELGEEELQQHCMDDKEILQQFFALVFDGKPCLTHESLLPSPSKNGKGVEAVSTPALVGEYMRVIVHQWNDTYIYIQPEVSTDDELTKVCYTYGNKTYNYDWTYLKDLFYKGCQLNLVRPRVADGIVYPELIIFEPDYLVNISTVAHCFTNYADSPMVELTKKLEPSKTSAAILLGNLAGQLLDETIVVPPGGTEGASYAQSVKTFFTDHAISLLTADIGPQFHQEAQQQRLHIAEVIHTALPSALKRFNAKDGIVEPSFFSEMLGLQGRMDYLQMDFRVLMEQKSGKGGFPYNGFVKPIQTDEHYIQMLLYMALIRYNYREVYERNGRELHAFLLYSKYSESLLGLGFSPELIFKAIKVRNELAGMEMRLTQPDAYRLLDKLTPDKLNEKHASNTLWNNYQRPQIENVLQPIHEATQLERAYYFRFLTFIANEHTMSKLGNKTKECSGFAATWHDDIEEKRRAGNIYDKLTLVSPATTATGKVSTVTLRFSETADNDMSNFRNGDIVILYPYPMDKEPDLRKTMVFRCTIEDIQPETISLTLRAAQADNRFFARQQGKLWAIEHDFMESSYSTLYKGMHAFLSAPKARRDLLLLQREPETDSTATLRGDYGTFNDMALSVKRAKDLFLIIGPPGTGKTSFGMLYTVKEELMEPDTSVLLLAYTNRAVDEICSKLDKEGIHFIRIGVTATCARQYRDRLLSSIVQQSANVNELKNTLLSARVIVGTTTSMNSNISLFQLKQFSLAVIDEASQILEPHLIGLMSAHSDGRPAIGKFVMIGDHKQLPAVVQQDEETSKVDDTLLNAIHLTNCRLSLFERLLRQYATNTDVTYMLRRQGRMHPDIAHFPNMTFYNNRLIEVPLPHQTETLPQKGKGMNGIVDLLSTRRIAFIDAAMPEGSSSDKVNQNEADIIAAIVVKIYETEGANRFDINETVGVIVPYRNQIATVRKTIDSYGIKPLHDITIDTVERYQGSQRRYIVYGFTIQKYYQLNFLTDNVFEDFDGCIVDRKLNVAMTRAEEHLIMIGNAALLSHNHTFASLIAFVRSKHGFFRVPKDNFIAGRFTLTP